MYLDFCFEQYSRLENLKPILLQTPKKARLKRQQQQTNSPTNKKKSARARNEEGDENKLATAALIGGRGRGEGTGRKWGQVVIQRR